jgi:hypothetical protein
MPERLGRVRRQKKKKMGRERESKTHSASPTAGSVVDTEEARTSCTRHEDKKKGSHTIKTKLSGGVPLCVLHEPE